MSSISISTHLEKDKVAFGKSQEVHLVVSVNGSQIKAERKPMHLSAVIDVSGSMSGQKVEYAKKTLSKLVENLSSQDTLGIVAYATQVEVVMEPRKMTSENKEHAKQCVERLHIRDCTNLSGGMLQGFSQLKGGDAVLVREFLMSDGLPNVGVSDLPGLVAQVATRPEGATLTTFGYGASDYNPELMESLAKAGKGNCYHVKNPDECPAFFGRELGGLLTCCAQNIQVKVKMQAGAKIKEVLSDYDVDGKDDGSEAMITLDDVYSEEKRRIVLRVELPETTKAMAARAQKVATIEASFQDIQAKEPRSEEATVKIEYVKPGEEQKEPSKLVQEEIARIKAAKAQDEAYKLAEQGNFSGARDLVMHAHAFCVSIGTPVADAFADDLKGNVVSALTPESYGSGGKHWLVSNKRGYHMARGMTAGTSEMYKTSGQDEMEKKFTGDDPQPSGPITIKPAPGPTDMTGISKKRTKRS